MKTETLNLNPSRGTTTAHVARPDTDSAAAVILIQEWWGINDHIRDIAGRYASEGFLCIAPDLYRGKPAKRAGEAGRKIPQQFPPRKQNSILASWVSPATAWAGRLPSALRANFPN